MPVIFASNGVTPADGIRVTRVSDGGQRFELLTDTASGRFSEVTLRERVTTERPGAADPVEAVGTPASRGLTYDAAALRALRMHVAFAADLTGDALTRYLWDALKTEMSASGPAETTIMKEV